MLERALNAGVPCAWVAGDSVYGADSSIRRELERRLYRMIILRGTQTASGIRKSPSAMSSNMLPLGGTAYGKEKAGTSPASSECSVRPPVLSVDPVINIHQCLNGQRDSLGFDENRLPVGWVEQLHTECSGAAFDA
jgi:hypothetical protein